MQSNELMKSFQETFYLRKNVSKKRFLLRIILTISWSAFFCLILLWCWFFCVCAFLVCVWNRKKHHHPKQMLLRADSISASVSVWKWTHTLSCTHKKNHWCQWSWMVKCTKSFFGIRWLCLAYVICSMIFVAIPLPLRVEWIRWKLDLIRWWSKFLTKFVPCIALHCIALSLVDVFAHVYVCFCWLLGWMDGFIAVFFVCSLSLCLWAHALKLSSAFLCLSIFLFKPFIFMIHLAAICCLYFFDATWVFLFLRLFFDNLQFVLIATLPRFAVGPFNLFVA